MAYCTHVILLIILKFLDKYKLLKNRYINHHFIYTDGSKTDEAVAAAAVCNGIVFGSRLPNAASIFSAEAKAILLALNFIECTFHLFWSWADLIVYCCIKLCFV